MSGPPRSIGELQRVVRDAVHVRPRAGGTKSGKTTHLLDLAGLTAIVSYEPAECVITALAGTPLAAIIAALARHAQYLPFDPPFVEEGATIGGTVAAGVSGPGRYRYGGVRDFVIGVGVVDGEGRLIRSGGRVVKNAAGFLLHHGVVGSCGRFGVIADVTLKVFPAPEARRMVKVACGTVEAAFARAREVEAQRFDCEAIDFTENGELRVTIAGRAAAIQERVDRLGAALGPGTVPVEGDSPPGRGLSPPEGTACVKNVKSVNLVKVPGAMSRWQNLRPHVTAAHFMCAGAVAWLTTEDLIPLDRALHDAQLTGQVLRGPRAGERIGHLVHNEFEERVRHVLDPHDRFSAAPHSRR